jgi:hypothetical protein
MSTAIDPRSAEIFEHELLNPLRGHVLTPFQAFIACLLLDASAEKPIDSGGIQRAMKKELQYTISPRVIKSIIRSLRKDHAFPIISRREKPAGYWWCSSKEEMRKFIDIFRGQALDELHTLTRIVNENYSELAGQLRLEDGGQQP